MGNEKEPRGSSWQRMLVALAMVTVALLSNGCATSQTRAERKAQTQQAVAEALTNRHLRIDIRSMSTLRYGTRPVSYGFYLTLKGDTLESYLPYVGQVYRTTVYSTSQGLNFEAPILSYRETHPKADFSRIELQVKTSEDVYVYILEVYDTGKAWIRVRAQNRDGISFDGDCDVP